MDILTFIGEVFLDTLIDHSQNRKISNKTRWICIIILTIISILYIALFSLVTYIGITSWDSDKIGSLKMFATGLLLILGFFAYAYKIKSNRTN